MMNLYKTIGSAIVCALYLAHGAEAGEFNGRSKFFAIQADIDLGELRGSIDDQIPINLINLDALNLDTMVTGIPYKDWLNQRPSSSFDIEVIGLDEPYIDFGSAIKFNSKGQPMTHHQEYPRPTAVSIAMSLLEAIELNPFPGN